MARLLLFLLLGVACALRAAPPPEVGLVLSGGGARGLAHVGVLKVLERERIPVRAIAGTSMGAIVGGLYAAGYDAATLERELLALDWAEVFARRVDRPHLSQRRKEEDDAFSPLLELGLRDGELRAPQGTVSARGLEVLLRRLTLPVRHVVGFDELPTPFRALATDMESGDAVVLRQGDLAEALRASMSVPGLFAPSERDGRLLGDGGLVNNLPVDVARAMGAQRVIAVNVGTPLAPRKELGSLLGLTAQMVNILTEQNVKRSLASLWEDDLLISPGLDGISSGSFERAAEIVRAGEQAAEALLPQLRAFAVSPERYAAWQAQRRVLDLPPPRLVAVRFEGSTLTRAERYLPVLASKRGEPFDAARATRDTRLLAASGDYARVDFRLEPSPVGDTLIFDLEDKPWGPNYLRMGLDLSTVLNGRSHYNLRFSHNRHWLNRLGGEWRNQLVLGRHPSLGTEWYQPLTAEVGPATESFVAAAAEIESVSRSFYQGQRALAQWRRQALTTSVEIGQPYGRKGELRLGWWQQSWRWRADIGPAPESVAQERTQRVGGLRARARLDLLDDVNFPRSGWRTEAIGLVGHERGSDRRVRRLELQATRADSWGRDTLALHAQVAVAHQRIDPLGGAYTLGGFQQLSGLRPAQLAGHGLLLLRASGYRRLTDAPVFTRGWFVGASLEAGNTWADARDLRLTGLRWAGSVFVGADTGLGPLHLALGHTNDGGSALYLFIGRP